MGLNRRGIATILLLLLLPLLAMTSEYARAQNASASSVLDPGYYGSFSNERNSLHEMILRSILGPKVDLLRNESPLHRRTRLNRSVLGYERMLFVSGAFGSGKSTLVAEALNDGRFDIGTTVVIDVDALRAQLPEWNRLLRQDPRLAVEATNREAGYLAERLLWEALGYELDIIFVSAHRDAAFNKKLVEAIRARYPERASRLEWIYVETHARLLRERIERRNGNETRQTEIAVALESGIQSRSAFREILPILPRAIEVEMLPSSSKQPYIVTAFYEDGRRRNVRGLLEMDLRSIAWPQTSGDLKSERFYDIVVDLDWTLISHTNEGKNLISFDGKSYAVAPYAVEVLKYWLRRTDVRVHIFSGGTRDRNISLLGQISVDSNSFRSLYDLIVEHGGKVLSEAELTLVAPNATGRADRARKRIESFISDAYPSRTIGIDDQARFGDGWLSMIPSFGIYNERSRFRPDLVGQKYEAESAARWRAHQGRWYVLAAMIEDAINVDRHGKLAFRDQLIKQANNLEFASEFWFQQVVRGQRYVQESANATEMALAMRARVSRPATQTVSCQDIFGSQ